MSHALHGFDDGLWVDGAFAPLGAESGGMNLNHWADAAWAYDSWLAASWGGEAAAEEEVGLGLAAVARPTDFVISPPYYLHLIQTYRKARAEPRARDEREFREMLQMYRITMGAP
jgi:hypothetical protein